MDVSLGIFLFFFPPPTPCIPLTQPMQCYTNVTLHCTFDTRDRIKKGSLADSHGVVAIGNDFRAARVAEVLADFRTLQYYIAAAPTEPPNSEDWYTEGWAALRQCSLDGQNILECAADTSVPETTGGQEEQTKAELKQ